MNAPTDSTAQAIRILLVDDEPDITAPLLFCLQQEGYDVRTAENGYEALGAVRAWQPQLVLLDVMLPKENGYRVSRFVKEDVARGVLPPVHVVLVTARKLDDPEREKSFAEFSQADAVVYKPFDIEAMLAMVRRLAGEPVPVLA